MKLPDFDEPDQEFDFSIYEDDSPERKRFQLGGAPKYTTLRSRWSDSQNTLNILGDMKAELAKKYYDMLKNSTDMMCYRELYAILTAIYMKVRYIQGLDVRSKVERVQKHCLKLISKYTGKDTTPPQLMKYLDIYTSYIYDMLWHNNLMADLEKIGQGSKTKEQIIQ